VSAFLLYSSFILAGYGRRLELGAVTAGRLDLTYLSVITASELLHGVHRADTPRRQLARSAFVEAVLTAFPILELDLAVARVHAKLWADLQSAGGSIGAHDLWIAASALAHSLTVMSTNARDFGRIPGLALEAVTLNA
jgi:predicted nucleic acid-binding protein